LQRLTSREREGTLAKDSPLNRETYHKQPADVGHEARSQVQQIKVWEGTKRIKEFFNLRKQKGKTCTA